MEIVRNALQLLLKSLPPLSKFSLVTFGPDSGMNTLMAREHVSDALDAALAKATDDVMALQADLASGPDFRQPLLAALQSVFTTEPAPGFPRQAFLFTCGSRAL